jgi:precorrin-2 dehydrogenase/sirohydrochlorin ferrochelatase
MVPIVLDGARLPIALVGRGPELGRRLAWLRDGGATDLTVYTDGPVAAAEDVRVVPRLPDAEALAAHRVAWVTGLADAEAATLARLARRLGVLVNVEDRLAWCDFHTPAVVRRGDLVLTASTGGRSPGLAQRVRRWLEERFGDEWEARLDLIATKRAAWRRRPRSLPELAALTDATIDRKGWLGRAT